MMKQLPDRPLVTMDSKMQLVSDDDVRKRLELGLGLRSVRGPI